MERIIRVAFEVSLRRRGETFAQIEGWEATRTLPRVGTPDQGLAPEYEGLSGKFIAGSEPWLEYSLTDFDVTMWTGKHLHTNSPEWFSQGDRSRISSWPKAPDADGPDQVTTPGGQDTGRHRKGNC